MSRQAIQPEQGATRGGRLLRSRYSPQEHRRRLPTPTPTPTATLALTGFSGQSLVSQKILKKGIDTILALLLQPIRPAPLPGPKYYPHQPYTSHEKESHFAIRLL